MSWPHLIPAEQMGQEAWARLTAAANDRAHVMRLATLATVGVEGRPAARLMVIRGADADDGRLWFHTDARSPKVADLRVRPFACAVTYDPGDGVELRLNGSARLHQRDAAADRHWEQTSLAIWYLSRTPPSMEPPAMQADPRLSGARTHPEEAFTRQAREHFAVIELVVDTIDWYQTLGDHCRHAVLRRDTAWRGMEVRE